ncbi:DEAD/DEAH box helicase [Coraliomargarita parva]|uniref:DEAD/DEAH box helicase n=1 Tax=Coraliomargarita parva TaxID=3014050 RepID=UPI0022B3EFDA|nr:DEAD/DEAH box helicase [Coraliomargarita parva]
MTFNELGLHETILKSIDEFGFKEPTPIQANAIPPILEGRDVIGSAQTGTGKTAAYALPILHRLGGHREGAPPRCLILGPTRELAAQVEDQFKSYGKYCEPKCCLVHGGVGYGKQIQELKAGADVVIATPGRLLDHLQQKNFDLRSIEVLVLDEVDRMVDMGFIDDVTRIIKLCNRNRQTLLFSATVSDEIKRLVGRFLKDPVEVAIGVKLSPAETVKHEIYPVGAMQKFDLLMALIEKMEIDSLIIFCRMKMGADRITRWLKEHQYNCAAMHSDLPQRVRTKSLEEFKTGKIQILVATDIASRGLDIANVTHVINYDVPEHPEDYVHRIGRTGRAQREGDAATILAPDEESKLHAIEKFIDQQIPQRKLEDFNYFHEPIIRSGEGGPPRRRRRNSASSRFGRRR